MAGHAKGDTPVAPDDLPRPDRAGAAEVALELLKQLITLSSGALALSATFATEFRGQFPFTLVLPASWAAFVVSIITALRAISTIVQSKLRPEHDWSSGKGKRNAAVSRRTFVLGLALLGVFGAVVLFGPTSDSATRSLTDTAIVAGETAGSVGSSGCAPSAIRSSPEPQPRTGTCDSVARSAPNTLRVPPN